MSGGHQLGQCHNLPVWSPSSSPLSEITTFQCILAKEKEEVKKREEQKEKEGEEI